MAIQSGNFAKILEPGLRTIFNNTYKEKKEQYSRVLNVRSSKKNMETDFRVGGFSEWKEKGSLDSSEYEDITRSDSVQYQHTTFSKGFQVERELVEDQMYTFIETLPKKLARAGRAKIERDAASIFNNAFTPSPKNYKGEALIAHDHKRLDNGLSDNYLGNLPLTEANLEKAFELSSSQVDENGLLIQMNPTILVVGRGLEFTAEKIAKSIQMPGTADNDINPLRGRFQVVALDYITSPTNWFLLDPDLHQLNFFWRKKLEFKGTNDFDTDVAKYKGTMRYSYGWSDHRGIIGAGA